MFEDLEHKKQAAAVSDCGLSDLVPSSARPLLCALGATSVLLGFASCGVNKSVGPGQEPIAFSLTLDAIVSTSNPAFVSDSTFTLERATDTLSFGVEIEYKTGPGNNNQSIRLFVENVAFSKDSAIEATVVETGNPGCSVLADTIDVNGRMRRNFGVVSWLPAGEYRVWVVHEGGEPCLQDVDRQGESPVRVISVTIDGQYLNPASARRSAA